jgi:hypothetical protein
MLSGAAAHLAGRLAALAQRGPVPSVGHGDTAVGMTLLDLLGVSYSSTSKPSFEGIALTARRGTKAKDPNRVNLFAKVPDWNLSRCKSSREIVDRYGYEREGGQKLYCTVRARTPNSQGLKLVVDRNDGLLREVHESGGVVTDVAAWRISGLEAKLGRSHGASAWIVAVPSSRGGQEMFHFRYATFTSAPRTSELAGLIEQRTVTMDHLISNVGGAVVEKGPLFKILPENAGALFPNQVRVDLLEL